MNSSTGAAYPYQTGGSLPHDAPSYVTRQADQDLLATLLAGIYCYVLNSRQIGKSSLRVRTAERLFEAGVLCVEVELLGIGSQQITAQQWYGGIIQALIQGLGLRINRRSWLRDHEDLSPVQRLGLFIEQVVLTQIEQPLVIFFDEIDSVLGLNFPTDEFFGLIRNCYEKRAINPAYQRLTVVMLGVATPSDLIQDPHSTPFNIGHAIELQGFSFAEAYPLVPGLATVSLEPEAVLREILSWTGGQPFLTQKVCQLVVEASRSQVVRTVEACDIRSEEEEDTAPHSPQVTVPLPPSKLVEHIVRTKIIANWEAQDHPEHLRTLRNRILRHIRQPQPRLRLYRQILKRSSIPVDDSRQQMELRLSGLVTLEAGRLRVFNRIYQTIFDCAWVAQQLKQLQAQTAQAAAMPFWQATLIGVGATTLVVMVRSLGLLQPFELRIFDRLMQWRPSEPADQRFLLITVSEADIQHQDRLGMDRIGSLSDQALLQIWQKLEPHQPRVIGLDFFHDFPFAPELAAELAASDRFIAVCEISKTVDVDTPVSIPAPPGTPIEQVGFTDFPIDRDYRVRRQLLGMPGSEECQTNQSFSLQVALHYLKPEKSSLKWLDEHLVAIGETALPKLRLNAGGYQLPAEEEGGYQILVNYRTTPPRQIALRDFLNGEIDAFLDEWARDRIVLIGLVDAKDAHFTPSQQNRTSGIVVHAHMASQLVSAVLDQRPLIWWWPEWLEIAWLGGWSILSGSLVWRRGQRYYIWLGLTGVLVATVSGLCYLTLLQGGWLPLVPSVVAIVITTSGVILYQKH